MQDRAAVLPLSIPPASGQTNFSCVSPFNIALNLQCLNCGSSLTDQPTDSNPDAHNPVDFANIQPVVVGFDALSGVDKQAMVEDWLNPETGEASGGAAPYLPVAPQVQHYKDIPDIADCHCHGDSAQLKFSKVNFVHFTDNLSHFYWTS